jgi:pteridine reductase
MKTALITGAGKRRVGWHVAEAFVEQGYAVAIHYRESATEARESVAHFQSMGVQAAAFQADLANEQAVRSLIAEVLEQFQKLEVLVNCAAIWHSKPLEEVTAADVREHFEINTLGTFLAAQHAGLAMVRQASGGCIVNIGDWAEIRPYLNYAAYFPSKGGVTALTRSLAVELGTRNPRVRVNCILPGPVMLPPELSQEERAAAIAATLVKREGHPRNIALAALHFVENDFVTGVCMPVDGGRSVFSPDHGG